MENIINTLIWAAILQGLLLGLIYLLSKKYRSKSNRILGFLLLALVIEALTMAPFIAIGKYPIIGYFSLPEVKLLLPVLILHYVLEKIGRASAYHLFLKFHYVLVCPFISITLFNVYLFVFRDQHIYQLFDFQIIEGVFMTMQYYAFILTIGAIGISLYETRNYTQVVKNSYSDLDLLQIRWLWQFIFSIIPITILWGMELFRIAIGGRGTSVFVSLTWLLLIVFIYFLSYKAFQQKNLLERLPTHRKLNNLPEKENHKISELQNKNMGSRLEAYMEEHKIYRRKDLTIYELAKEMEESPRSISESINNQLGKNFSEWINSYRVEEAVIKLKDDAFNHLSIEGIGLDAGFKSRSAMYAAFNKETGYSPGHFRP